MGGGQYSYDVGMQARSGGGDIWSYGGYGVDAGTAAAHRQVDKILNPFGKNRECKNKTAVVVALDVTRSRGDDTKTIYEKLPMMMGQIEMKGYVEGAAISFTAVGDAKSDNAPLQVGQFEADNRLDEVLSKFWIEEGGGGTGQESYELCAYYYARHSILDCHKQGRKGYFFFVGDEGFYPRVSRDEVRQVCGQEIPGDVDSAKIFHELQEKYNTFLIFPKKTWEQRKVDIDAEIKQRVEAAGGQYKNVDIRASLIWNNRNDLDLHVIAPSGEEIFYGHKQSACGGWLDVDMNVQGETTKPVENVRWVKGQAPKGHYKIVVQNYSFHEKDQKPSDFRLELEVNGEFKHFTGTISSKGETGAPSNVVVSEFDYDPSKRAMDAAEKEKLYAGYDDTTIKKQWASVIPSEHILLIEDPASIIDVILGALSIMEGKGNLDSYMLHMREREQSTARIEETWRALEGLSRKRGPTAHVQPGHLGGNAPQRGGGTHRL